MKRGWNILVVEDEALIAMDLRLRLLQEGAGRVRVVATGEESIACAAGERFDLVVMDDHLAGELDGVEAAERIRSSSQTPIIFISGYPKDEAFLARTARLCPAAFLDKPIDYRRLMAVIDALPE